MAPHLTDRYLINSIIRACNLLRHLSKEKTYFKLSELARELHLDRSTTYRILLSLERCGFIERDEKTGQYGLGMGVFELGNAFLSQRDFVKVSKPIMVDLASRVQETVHLAVLSQTEIVYIDKADSPRTLGVISKIGQRAPLYCTALGKVLLAHQPKESQLRILKELKLKPFTSNTITSKKRLLKELEEIRKCGYSLDRREYEEGVECIAAPIRDHLGNVIAALSISGPQRKIGVPQEKDFINQVVESAKLISQRIGYKEGDLF